jgi:sensor histidine kinase YesM
MTNLSRQRYSIGLFILICAASIMVFAMAHHFSGASWLLAAGAGASVGLPGAFLGLGVWRIARRGREPRQWQWKTAWHAAGAILFSGLWVVLIYGLIFLFYRPAAAAFWRNGASFQFIGGLMVYGMIVGVAQAVRANARLRERELAAARAELQALRARLDPHFLFNTLHSLTTLVRHDQQAAEDTLERFGDLMRYVLETNRNGRDEDVALADELEFIRNYLALERLRLGERLRVDEEIEPDALEYALPALLLQPLVENAVRHGIAPLRRGGTLRIAARCDGEALLLEVADNGAGAEAGQWQHATGLGLQVVRRRLAARFPDAHQCHVVTHPGKGFTIRLEIPARAAPPSAGLHGWQDRRVSAQLSARSVL